MSAFWRWIADRWFFLSTFFPIKLFFLHLRRSHLLLIFWFVLFGFVTGFIGAEYGFQYLFLSPEYLEEVSFTGYLILGLTAGLFTMAFHINSYIYYSYRFPFLATLNRPLWKFSINNFIIPTAFLLVLIGSIANFLNSEGWSFGDIALHIAGLILGLALSISFTLTYFISTIKTLKVPSEGKKVAQGVKTLQNLINIGRSRNSVSENPQPVHYYLKNFVSVRITRGVNHYQRERLLETIDQHHLSAAFYFLLLIVLVVLLSLVNPSQVFRIPAGATLFLIFSLYLMVIGAFYSRFKTWTVTVGLVLVLLVNYLSGFEPFRKKNFAYGMNYEVPEAPYNYRVLDSLTTDSVVHRDLQQGIERLENWRSQFPQSEKPRLVILNLSGGGLRSTVWTMRVLQQLDSITQGSLYPQVQLITGSSGGMLGAAFYRELKYRARADSSLNPNNNKHLYHCARDILNPVTFTLAVNDLFFRIDKVQYGQHSYAMDRGYTFDQRLLENTYDFLDKPLVDYTNLEHQGIMPTMILAPTIVGDGRKLLMCTQGLSYLTFSKPYQGIGKEKEYDGVEFRRLFKQQEADSLHFATALRLSASFPYITPLVNMPSTPGIELIDAGVRDNEGLELAFRYIYHFQEWIKANTSGVSIIQIKANRPDEIPIAESRSSRLKDLVLPISGVVKSFSNLQIYNKALLMEFSHEFLKVPLEITRFSLLEKKETVSLSWHLTEAEKQEIISKVNTKRNQEAFLRLQGQFP